MQIKYWDCISGVRSGWQLFTSFLSDIWFSSSTGWGGTSSSRSLFQSAVSISSSPSASTASSDETAINKQLEKGSDSWSSRPKRSCDWDRLRQICWESRSIWEKLSWNCWCRGTGWAKCPLWAATYCNDLCYRKYNYFGNMH